MKIKKIPLRTCVITREKFPKEELLRVVCDNTNNVSVDLSGKANGRGAYVKKDLAVIKKARSNKQLDRRLEATVPEEIYDELEKIVRE